MPLGSRGITPARLRAGEGASYLYVTLARRPDLDGQYAVFGHVVEGEDVPAALQVGDEIRRVYVRE